MTRTRFTVKEVDKGWTALRDVAKKMRAGDAYVKAGALGSGRNKERAGDAVDNVELMAIHEFGSPDRRIPERSVIRASFNANTSANQTRLRELIRGVYEGRVTVSRALGVMGLKMVADMQTWVRQGSNLLPNSAATVKAKGSSRPLIDTGRLMQSLSHEVVIPSGLKGGR